MKRFLRSFICAVKGILRTLKEEKNFKIHVIIALSVFIAGAYIPLSFYNWVIVIILISLVIAFELLNTAIEHIADYVSEKKEKRLIKYAKDASAAAVLTVSIAAALIGTYVVLIPFVKKLSSIFL